MVYVCKGSCRFKHKCIIDGIEISGAKLGMVNIKPSIGYLIANRCSICSESNESIWYLKTVKDCPCCGAILRRKSKHSFGRQKVTNFIMRNR